MISSISTWVFGWHTLSPPTVQSPGRSHPLQTGQTTSATTGLMTTHVQEEQAASWIINLDFCFIHSEFTAADCDLLSMRGRKEERKDKKIKISVSSFTVISVIELHLPPATDRWQNIVSSCTHNPCYFHVFSHASILIRQTFCLDQLLRWTQLF